MRKRDAYESLSIIMGELGQTPPVIRDPALNERHYGELQGLDKAKVAQRVGAEQVQRWRRSYHVAPPGGESLEATARRAVPFFERAIGGDLHRGRAVLVVAHGSSLRAIIMKLDALSHDEVVDVELETGVPIAYELTTDGTVVDKKVSGDSRRCRPSWALPSSRRNLCPQGTAPQIVKAMQDLDDFRTEDRGAALGARAARDAQRLDLDSAGTGPRDQRARQRPRPLRRSDLARAVRDVHRQASFVARREPSPR